MQVGLWSLFYSKSFVLKYLAYTVIEIDVSPHDPNQGSPSALLHLQNWRTEIEETLSVQH